MIANKASCVALATLSSAGCKKQDEWTRTEVSYDLIEVARNTQKVITGEVGVGRWNTMASYVLVDARNISDDDLLVTMGGTLDGEDKSVVGTLRRQSLRIPAGGVRTFALVDKNDQPRAASSATVAVVGAMKALHKPSVIVTDGNVYRDGDRVVVAGYVVNIADREVHVVVIAGFYDESGAPMRRPSTKYTLTGNGKRSAQFVGPDGSRSAYLFIGDAAY